MKVTFEEVKKVVVDVLKIDGSEITPETEFIKDLKADSMDQFFLIDGFSEAFNITIPDDQAKEIRSVQDVIDVLEKM